MDKEQNIQMFEDFEKENQNKNESQEKFEPIQYLIKDAEKQYQKSQEIQISYPKIISDSNSPIYQPPSALSDEYEYQMKQQQRNRIFKALDKVQEKIKISQSQDENKQQCQ